MGTVRSYPHFSDGKLQLKIMTLAQGGLAGGGGARIQTSRAPALPHHSRTSLMRAQERVEGASGGSPGPDGEAAAWTGVGRSGRIQDE